MVPTLANDAAVAVGLRLDAMQAQVDRMAAYLGSYATAASVLVTTLAILVTVAIALSATFAVIATRSRRLANSLRASIDEMELKRQDLEASYTQRIAQLENRITNYHDGLMSEVIARSGLMRELVAGELSYRRSDYRGALVHFRSVHELEPGNAEAAYYLGRTLTNLDKLDEAVETYERLLTSDPANARAMRGLALALRFRDPQRARDIAASALAVASVPADVRHNLHNEYALLLRDDGDHEGALRQHQAALLVRPSDTVTEYFVGVAELLCGREVRGNARLSIARERVRLELEDGTLRPLWAAVIVWSAAFVQGATDEVERQIEELRRNLDSRYLAHTVQTHLVAIGKVTGRPVPTL